MSDMRGMLQGFQASYGNFSQVGGELVSAMYDAYKYSAGVENQIFLTSKIAGATAKEAQELFQVAQDVNLETPLTAADIASGERYLAMAGKTAAEIKDLIRPAAQLATIFGGSVGEKGGYADMMTNMMAMFNLSTTKTSQVADDLYTAVTSANLSMEDLMATIRYSGADMSAVGIQLQEVAAAAGALGDVGIQGSMAGTSLSNMIRNLQLSLAEQKKYGSSWLQSLGLTTKDFYDAEGNFKGLYNALQQFLKIYDQMNPLTRTQAFYNIFGVRGMRAIVPVLNAMSNGNDKMGLILEKMATNTGALDNTLKQWIKTNRGTIEQFESALENWKVTFGQVIAPTGKFILDEFINPVLTNSAQWMRENKTGASLVRTGVNVALIYVIKSTLVGIFTIMQRMGAYVDLIYKNGIQVSNGAMSSAMNTRNTTAAVVAGFRTTESLLIKVLANQGTMNGILMRQLQIQMGVAYNRAGQLYVTNPRAYQNATGQAAKKGQYAKKPNIIAMGMTGDPVFKRWSKVAAAKAASQNKPITGKLLGWLPKIVSGVGKIAMWGIRLTNWVGWIMIALEVLPWIWDGLKSFFGWMTGKDEQERKEREMAKRKEQAEAVWYAAINAGIRDGLRDSTIRIQVNGNNLNYSPGTTVDYTGAALIGQ